MRGGGKRERTTSRSTGRQNQALSKQASPKRATAARASRSAAKGAADSATSHPVIEVVEQLATILDQHGLGEIIVETGDLNLTLRRGVSAAVAPPYAYAVPSVGDGRGNAAPMAPPGASSAGAQAAEATPAAPAEDPSHHVVTSPFVGTFYRSPGPESEPYVTEGKRVEKGQVLCIVEAMKLMNEIEADTAGVVVEVLVDNAQPVEYGQPLFKIATR